MVIVLTTYINIVTLKNNNIQSILHKDLCSLLSNSHQGPASSLTPSPTPYTALPCAAPEDNSDLVPPTTMTSRNSPPSPTSVLMDPLVGLWVPSTLIPVTRLRDPAVSIINTPSTSRSSLDPLVKPWCQLLQRSLAILRDPPVPKTPPKPIEVHHTDPLRHVASTTAEEMHVNNNTITFIQSRQQPTLAMPPQLFHPAADLLHSYTKNKFPAKVGPQWPLASIMAGIKKGPHTSATSQQSTAFCRRELLECSQRGFSIILSVCNALHFFGRKIGISRLACLDYQNRKPRLICNSSKAPDTIIQSVNDSTDKSINPQAMQFGSCLPRLLQNIWEADPDKGPVLISKWDISDAFHRCHIYPEDVGAFTYVVPLIPLDPEPLLCIDLVLPMSWVNSPDLFCATSETVTDEANITFLSDLTPQLSYLPTAGLYKAFPAQPAGPSRLQYADVYMDDINCLTQGDQTQQRRLMEIVLQSLKVTYPMVIHQPKKGDCGGR